MPKNSKIYYNEKLKTLKAEFDDISLRIFDSLETIGGLSRQIENISELISEETSRSTSRELNLERIDLKQKRALQKSIVSALMQRKEVIEDTMSLISGDSFWSG